MHRLYDIRSLALLVVCKGSQVGRLDPSLYGTGSRSGIHIKQIKCNLINFYRNIRIYIGWGLAPILMKTNNTDPALAYILIVCVLVGSKLIFEGPTSSTRISISDHSLIRLFL